MTIEDFICKFFFNLQLTKQMEFTGPELYTYVRTEMYKYNHRYIEDQSILRELRDMKSRNKISYTTKGPNKSIYVRI